VTWGFSLHVHALTGLHQSNRVCLQSMEAAWDFWRPFEKTRLWRLPTENLCLFSYCCRRRAARHMHGSLWFLVSLLEIWINLCLIGGSAPQYTTIVLAIMPLHVPGFFLLLCWLVLLRSTVAALLRSMRIVLLASLLFSVPTAVYLVTAKAI
jgi:hypothetical protein